MANLMDIAECLAMEGRLAQDYDQMEKDAKDKDFKKDLELLKKYSVEKMRILHRIVKDGPWMQHEKGINE